MPAQRQLVAILFADIQGFTALVEQDETQAKIIEDKFQNISGACFKKYHGRIIQFQGDGVCCIFKSAGDGVLAAVEVQQQMLTDPKVPLRIGIHLGDVILEGKAIFGNGVNIASRVESFALPGGVFISDTVYREIKNNKAINGNFSWKIFLQKCRGAC